MTAERYAAVFTGILSLKKPGEYQYLTMTEEPRGRLPAERLRREVPFSELPAGCRRVVLDFYREL